MADLTADDLSGKRLDDIVAQPEAVPGLVDTTQSPNLVGRTPDTELAHNDATKQSWYNTLGIGGDNNTETLTAGIADQFSSGGNWAKQIYDRIDREAGTTDDPNFDSRAYVNEHSTLIPLANRKAILQSGSEKEAWENMQAMQSTLRAQERIQHMGVVGQFVSAGVAGIIDVDAPLTFAMGGMNLAGNAGLTATRMGRLFAGAAEGGISAGLAGSAGEEANPMGDWRNIGVAAFANAAFGAWGHRGVDHAFEKGNAVIRDAVEEFNKTAEYGNIRAKDDIRVSPLDQSPHHIPEEPKVEVPPAAGAAPAVEVPPHRKPGAFNDLGSMDLEVHDTPTPRRDAWYYMVDMPNVGKPSEFYTGRAPNVHTGGPVSMDGYHGTDATFEKFDPAKLGSKTGDAGSKPSGFYFSKSEATAKGYGSNVRKENITMDNPYVVDAKGKGYLDIQDELRVISYGIEHGKPGFEAHDGMIVRNVKDGAKQKLFGNKADDVFYVPARRFRDTAREFKAGERSGDGGSIGARQLNQQGTGITTDNDAILQRGTASKAYIRANDLDNKYYYDYAAALGSSNPIVRGLATSVRYLTEAMNKIGVGSDFDKLYTSGSETAKVLAYTTGEHPGSVLTNNKSAAAIMDHYEKNLAATWQPVYQDSAKSYISKREPNKIRQVIDREHRANFHREIIAEMEARRLDGPTTGRSVDPDVKATADALDRWSAKDAEIGKGRANEHAVKGYENIEPYSGYIPRKWSGGNIVDFIRNSNGRYTESDLRQALSEAYQKTGDAMPKETADKIAGAMLSRAKATDRGVDVNLWSLLQGDGRDVFMERMKDMGIPQHEADKMLERLTGQMEERGRAGHTKGRLDMDLRFVASNGIKIMDLIDTDIDKIVSGRVRNTAGQAALARVGIKSKAEQNEVIETILHEQQANGVNTPTGTTLKDKANDFLDGDRHVNREFLDAYFGYFSGQHNSGASAMYGRIRKATQLSLMNQLGLTSLAEFGAVAAGLGAREFFNRLPAETRAMFSDVKSELHKELEPLGIMIPEHRLFSTRYHAEMDKSMHAASDFEQHIDNTLNIAGRIQGFASGFYKVLELNQRLAIVSSTNRIMQTLSGGSNPMSIARMESIGFNADLSKRIAVYAKDAVTYDEKGNVLKHNFDKWKPEDVDEYAYALNRATDQYVQKARIGESSWLFHKDGLSSLFFHLKAFPILAVQKQLARNVNIADTESVMQAVYGMAAAGTIYASKQLIAGHTDNLTPEKIGKGAFGMSNMTGWLPMATDPIASVLGLNSLKFNSYAYGVDDNVISSPAGWPTLNRMANIPGALGHLITTGGLSSGDVRALQSTPLIGNFYGFTHILNMLRSDRP